MALVAATERQWKQLIAAGYRDDYPEIVTMRDKQAKGARRKDEHCEILMGRKVVGRMIVYDVNDRQAQATYTREFFIEDSLLPRLATIFIPDDRWLEEVVHPFNDTWDLAHPEVLEYAATHKIDVESACDAIGIAKPPDFFALAIANEETKLRARQ